MAKSQTALPPRPKACPKMQKIASFLLLGAGMAVKSAAEVLPTLVGIVFGESRAKVTDQTTVFWFLR